MGTHIQSLDNSFIGRTGTTYCVSNYQYPKLKNCANELILYKAVHVERKTLLNSVSMFFLIFMFKYTNNRVLTIPH